MAHKVVVIEDEEDVQILIQRKLSKQGYHVVVAGNGRSGIDLVKREAPDLVLLDVLLPDMKGFEACQAIRDSGYAGKVIIYTAKADAVDAQRARQAGADDFTVKTEGLGVLSETIKDLLAG